MQFDIEKFGKALEFFRTSFVEHWEDEKYKWQAVKHFQENWNIDAEDFSAMFEKATKKSSNLLDSGNFFPRGMILEFSKENPKTTRQMFEILFDENKNISERIEKFKNIADELQETHNHNNSSKWKSHFQFVLAKFIHILKHSFLFTHIFLLQKQVRYKQKQGDFSP